MLYLDLPLIDRVKRIADRGLLVEIWDWSSRDVDALAGSGAEFSSMTGYLTGNMTEPDGIEELLATAAQSLEVADRLDCPRLNHQYGPCDLRAMRMVVANPFSC
jgi:hydroxypyruvate isomerase